MISIKQIQNFLVLAEVLHFAKAAAQLTISQATLSSEIKKLETRLGVQLFDRSDKWEIKLTLAGETYYNCVKNIPNDIAKAQQEALKSARGQSGSLTIAVSSIAYDYIDLGAICQKMRLNYPDVKLKILDMPHSRDRFDTLYHGTADIAIFGGSSNIAMPDGFAVKSLLPLKIVLALPKQSRLAKIENLTIADLKNTHFVLPPREGAPNLRQAWDEIFMEHCQSLPIVTHEVAGIRGIMQFVSAGLGAGFIFMRGNNFACENVVLRELPVTMNRSLMAAYREETQVPVVRIFLQLLAKNIEQN